MKSAVLSEELEKPLPAQPEDKPAWHHTGWGILTASVFFLVALFCLIWGVWGKPGWVRVSLANCNVALLAVAATYLFLRARPKAVRLVLGVLWLLLLPNTAYVFTDIGHIVYQWSDTPSASGRVLLVAQYLLLELFAVLAFLYAFHPFEKIVDRVAVFRQRKVLWLIGFNFLVAYGMVLGRFEHLNSYAIVTSPLKVLGAAVHIFTSFDLLGLTIGFGLLCNTVYFLFRGARR